MYIKIKIEAFEAKYMYIQYMFSGNKSSNKPRLPVSNAF